MIAQGRLAATGDYRDLRELMDDRPHRIRIATSAPKRIAALYVEHEGLQGLQFEEGAVTISTTDPEAVYEDLPRMVIENDLLVFDYKLKDGIARQMNATYLMKKMGIVD